MKWNRTKCGHWIDRKDASSCSDSNCIGIFKAQKSRMSRCNHSASCDRPKTVSENVFVIQNVCLIWKGLGHFPYYLQSTRLSFGSTSQNINYSVNYIYIHEPLIAPVLFLNQSFTPVSMNFSTVCVCQDVAYWHHAAIMRIIVSVSASECNSSHVHSEIMLIKVMCGSLDW